VKNKTGKVMVVCSDVSDAVKAHLDCDSWLMIWAYDAKAAIAKVRRERFDLAVLISTGQEMDITETLFNLRDIRQSMPIAVVQSTGAFNDAPTTATYLPTDNNLIAVQDLDDVVRLLQTRQNSVIGHPLRDHTQT
jgi:hypothetical protein